MSDPKLLDASHYSCTEGWLSKLMEGTPLQETEVRQLVEKVRKGRTPKPHLAQQRPQAATATAGVNAHAHVLLGSLTFRSYSQPQTTQSVPEVHGKHHVAREKLFIFQHMRAPQSSHSTSHTWKNPLVFVSPLPAPPTSRPNSKTPTRQIRNKKRNLPKIRDCSTWVKNLSLIKSGGAKRINFFKDDLVCPRKVAHGRREARRVQKVLVRARKFFKKVI